MLTISYIANLLVLVPLLYAFAINAPAIGSVFGVETDARRILVCIYAAIAAASALGLCLLGLGKPDLALQMGVTLFALQILCKALTVVIVGPSSPVVQTNLVIAALHVATLTSLWMARA
jgi:hypothetical protein